MAGYVPWQGWEKYFYNPYDKKLYSDDLKYGFSTDDLQRYHYLVQAYEQLLTVNVQKDTKKAFRYRFVLFVSKLLVG